MKETSEINEVLVTDSYLRNRLNNVLNNYITSYKKQNKFFNADKCQAEIKNACNYLVDLISMLNDNGIQYIHKFFIDSATNYYEKFTEAKREYDEADDLLERAQENSRLYGADVSSRLEENYDRASENKNTIEDEYLLTRELADHYGKICNLTSESSMAFKGMVKIKTQYVVEILNKHTKDYCKSHSYNSMFSKEEHLAHILYRADLNNMLILSNYEEHSIIKQYATVALEQKNVNTYFGFAANITSRMLENQEVKKDDPDIQMNFFNLIDEEAQQKQ